MDPQDMTKSQVILKMLCSIYDNPSLTPRDLQTKLGISRDKYFRYFTELSQIVNVTYCRKEKSFIISPPVELKELLGDPQELVAFLIILRALMKEEGIDSSRSFSRIRNILGMGQDFDHMEKYVAELERKSLDPGTRSNLALLFGAIILRHKVRLSYHPAGSGIIDIEVEPYRLLHYKDSFYLLGLPSGKSELRNYKLSRIDHLEVTQETFKMPGNVDIQPFSVPWDFGEGAPVRVRIRLSRKAVLYRLRERVYHPTQELKELPEGGAEFTVEVKSPERMLSWILSFGRDAEILEPESLKDLLVNELEGIRSLYTGNVFDDMKEATQ